ncbi:MAG: response regulator, partial [Deltaproteobacteria bacterium]
MAEHKPRVLIVDDEEEIRKILSNILEKEGFEVITAPDGEQAM